MTNNEDTPDNMQEFVNTWQSLDRATANDTSTDKYIQSIKFIQWKKVLIPLIAHLSFAIGLLYLAYSFSYDSIILLVSSSVETSAFHLMTLIIASLFLLTMGLSLLFWSIQSRWIIYYNNQKKSLQFIDFLMRLDHGGIILCKLYQVLAVGTLITFLITWVLMSIHYQSLIWGDANFHIARLIIFVGFPVLIFGVAKRQQKKINARSKHLLEIKPEAFT